MILSDSFTHAIFVFHPFLFLFNVLSVAFYELPEFR